MFSVFSRTPPLILASVISTLVPVIICAVWWRRIPRETWFGVFLTFLVVAGLTEMVVYVHSLLGMANAWLAHIYTPIEYGLLAYLLSILHPDPTTSKAIKVSIPVYLCTYAILKLFGTESTEMETINYLSRPVALFLIAGFSLTTLHKMRINAAKSQFVSPQFWILVGISSYYSASLVLDPFLYTKSIEILTQLVYTRAGLNILHNLLFTIGIYLAFESRPTEMLVKRDE